MVLDEPNSNLDVEGEAALTEALCKIRQRGGIAIVIAHRPSALAACDMVGVVQNGKLVAFGPKEEIIRQPGRAANTAAASVAFGGASPPRSTATASPVL